MRYPFHALTYCCDIFFNTTNESKFNYFVDDMQIY